jgi:hypothetical protein
MPLRLSMKQGEMNLHAPSPRRKLGRIIIGAGPVLPAQKWIKPEPDQLG